MQKVKNLSDFRRLLLVRADRIGDVVVTTPVFEAVKKQHPNCYLAVMVKKENADLVEGNPYVDEVISYDYAGKDRSVLAICRFAYELKKKKFDVAVHFHPRERMNWMTWLAQIPVRVGYRSKNFWLLTHTIPDLKREGKKHEAEYNFDLVKMIGIEKPASFQCRVSLQEQFRAKAESLLGGLKRYVVYNPSASCVSKIWPAEYFAEVADDLARKYHFATVIIGGPSDERYSNAMKQKMKNPAIDLTGKLRLGELAWIYKKASLLISNDSGPVHIASALEIPVVSIFGRNLAGLNPMRWRPLSSNSRFIQKNVGCVECLAHRCTIQFQCLRDLSPKEVISLIEESKGAWGWGS